MKILKQLNNVEKARLLFQLFPNEIPSYLDTMQGMCADLITNEAQHRADWQDGLFNFDFWFGLASQADKIIKQYGNKLHKGGRLFTDNLFDGYIAMFSVHCLTEYAKTRQRENRKFFLAVEVFF